MAKLLFTEQQLFEFIKEYEPFKLLTEACLHKIASALTIQSFPGNTLLIRKGEMLSDLYILFKGRLAFQVTDQGGRVTYRGEYAEGAVIGEMALLSDLPRSADVYSVHDSIILQLSKQDFLQLSILYPELLNKLTQFTINRLTRSLQGIQPVSSSNKFIAIVPIHPIEDLDNTLQEIIEKYPYGEKILLLTEKIMQEHPHFFDEQGVINQEGVLWINQQEAKCSIVLYLAQDSLSKWTKFCIRQAETIVWMAAAYTKEYQLTQTEQYVKTMHEDFIKYRYLVLLHDDTNMPSDTQFWLENRIVDTHFHIHNHTEFGYAKLMRILTEHTIALVLSGGGAKGLVHIGVHKLLNERSIPIDFVAGSSMGSIFAAGIAMEAIPQEELSMVKEYLVSTTKLDYTFPYISIAAGKRVSEGLQSVCGEDTRIENLWNNYFCVSTNLIDSSLYVHKQGLLWKAIRASTALPLIYPPVSLGNKLLTDGGILSHLPIDVMRAEAPSSVIIASNIVDDDIAFQKLPTFISGWKLLYNQIVHKKNITPINAVELVHRLMTISSSKATETGLKIADHCISLNVTQYGLLDFDKYHEISRLGYIQAKEQFGFRDIEELLKLKPLGK